VSANSANPKRNRASRCLVKFDGELAREQGVRLSALVFHVVGWLPRKLENNPNAYEYDPCKKFGEALGIGPKQVYRLLQQAKKLGLLDYRRSLRQTLVWVTKPSLFNTLYTHYYDRDLAKEYGLNGSILYAKIYEHTARPEPGVPPGYRANFYRWVKKFPWMTEASVKIDLIRLRHRKLIDWDQESCHYTSNRYFTTQLFAAPLEESTINTLRRQLGLKPDHEQGQPEPGRKSGSPRSGGDSGKSYYNLDEE